MAERNKPGRSILKQDSASVVILGAGVIGITSAYALAKAGFSVTVLERKAEAGQGTSAENGAQLSYGFADPISSPATLRRVPAIITGRDPGINVKARHLLARPAWALKFLRNCLPERSAQNTNVLTRLALHSRAAMRQLRADTQIEFDFAPAGRLVVYEQEKVLAGAQSSVAIRNMQGCSLQILDRAACLKLEPALENWRAPFVGGIYSATDEVGDAGKFCRALARFCHEELGVAFHYGCTVKAIATEGDGIVGVTSSAGATISADLVVNCMGPDANNLAGQGGAVAPILPLKGYSLTLGLNANSPAVSIASAEHRVVFARIGERMRIAGLAHVRGDDLNLDQAFVGEMRQTAEAVFPGAGDYDDLISSWCGLRPLTPDGLPSIGKTRLANLYVNTGHGGLGWTLAAGSADLLVRTVSSGAPVRLNRRTDFSAFANTGDGSAMAS